MDSYYENEGPSLQEMIDSDLKTNDVITHFQGIFRPDMITDLELDSYPSFSNSYLEDFKSSAFVLVNPNNVVPLHHTLQPQQVTNLSVNTSSNLNSQQQNSPQSPISLQEIIDSDMKADEVITENSLNLGLNFEGMDSFDMLRGTSILGDVRNVEISGVTQQLLCSKSHDFMAVFALAHSKINQIA